MGAYKLSGTTDVTSLWYHRLSRGTTDSSIVPSSEEHGGTRADLLGCNVDLSDISFLARPYITLPANRRE